MVSGPDYRVGFRWPLVNQSMHVLQAFAKTNGYRDKKRLGFLERTATNTSSNMELITRTAMRKKRDTLCNIGADELANKAAAPQAVLKNDPHRQTAKIRRPRTIQKVEADGDGDEKRREGEKRR